MAHARLGPSNHRWPHCPGSLREEENYPYEPSSTAAIDGTGSHLLKELVQATRKPGARADIFLGKVIGVGHKDCSEGWYVEQDRVDRVNMALNYFDRREEELNGISIMTETKSDPGLVFGRDDWWGTVDDTIISRDETTLEVDDYKDGRQFVYVRDPKTRELNSQLVGYAVGKLYKYVMQQSEKIPNIDNCKVKNVRLGITQPKTNPPIRYEDVTVREVWEAGMKLAQAAKLTDDENAPLIAGSWCVWCKHGKAGNCTAKNQKAVEGITQMTSLPTVNNEGKATLLEMIQTGQVAADKMDDATIANVLDAAPLIKALCNQVEMEAQKRLTAGTFTDTRYKIGNGRSSNVWVDLVDAEDENAAEEIIAKKLRGMRFLVKDIYPAKLISPAQALKRSGLTNRQKKKLSEEMIKNVPGKEKVVRAAIPLAEPVPKEEMFLSFVKPKPQKLSFIGG